MIIASIDIGTNTVLLLIADVDCKNHIISTVLNEQRMPRLGEGLISGKNIEQDKIDELFKILDEYRDIIKNQRTEKVLLTATNALRIAGNATQITDKITRRYNWNTEIISGEKEAEFAYLGATSGSKNEIEGLVIDIGGGSTELISGCGKKITFRKSFQTGSVHSTERFFKTNPPEADQTARLEEYLQYTFAEVKDLNSPKFAIAVSGTATTLACMIRRIKDYSHNIIEGAKLNKVELSQVIEHIKLLTSAEIIDEYGSVVNGREDIILAGAFILLNIMQLTSLSEVIVSSHGIRYGAIVSYLNQDTHGD